MRALGGGRGVDQVQGEREIPSGHRDIGGGIGCGRGRLARGKRAGTVCFIFFFIVIVTSVCFSSELIAFHFLLLLLLLYNLYVYVRTRDNNYVCTAQIAMKMSKSAMRTERKLRTIREN